MSREIEYMLLHFDYAGVGTVIYTLSLILTYCFYYAHEIERDNIVAALGILYFCNGCIQLLPCYAAEKFLLHKNVLFLTCAFSILVIVLCWAFLYSTD